MYVIYRLNEAKSLIPSRVKALHLFRTVSTQYTVHSTLALDGRNVIHNSWYYKMHSLALTTYRYFPVQLVIFPCLAIEAVRQSVRFNPLVVIHSSLGSNASHLSNHVELSLNPLVGVAGLNTPSSRSWACLLEMKPAIVWTVVCVPLWRGLQGVWLDMAALHTERVHTLRRTGRHKAWGQKRWRRK